MKLFLIMSVIVYVVITLGGASASLVATIQIYTLWGREPPEILTASIVNTAAIFAATTFIGVLDMFMTLWTLLKSKDWEEEARKEREADRQAREKERAENRQLREAELQMREKERAENRQAQEKEREMREKERAENRLIHKAELQMREKELEANRQLREAELQAREQARLQAMEAEKLAREQSLQETRLFQQRILDQLTAEQGQRDLMTTRVLDLLEQVSRRLNGNGSRNHPE